MSVAPAHPAGSVVVVRDEEWVVSSSERAGDGWKVRCVGRTELVRGTTATFLSPPPTHADRDASRRCRRARSTHVRRPAQGREVTTSDVSGMPLDRKPVPHHEIPQHRTGGPWCSSTGRKRTPLREFTSADLARVQQEVETWAGLDPGPASEPLGWTRPNRPQIATGIHPTDPRLGDSVAMVGRPLNLLRY
jgi:hypothetical protein